MRRTFSVRIPHSALSAVGVARFAPTTSEEVNRSVSWRRGIPGKKTPYAALPRQYRESWAVSCTQQHLSLMSAVSTPHSDKPPDGSLAPPGVVAWRMRHSVGVLLGAGIAGMDEGQDWRDSFTAKDLE